MLKITGLSKSYGKVSILNDVNFLARYSTLYILKGENGAGKSTLLKLISGIIYKTEGSLIRDGIISYLPDKFRLPKMMKVKSFIYEVMEEKDKNEVKRLMTEYDIEDKRIGELSKGNLVKLGILYTFMEYADIYMLDEPLDGLDDFAKRLLKDKIKDALKKKHTVILSLHSKSYFQDMNPVILEVKEGHVNEKKKKRESMDSVSLSDFSEDE